MAYSQDKLGRRFMEGAKSGSASNVEIRECDWGGTMLVAYGHAVYAYRFPDGFIVTFYGWYQTNNTRKHSGGSNKSQFRRLGITDFEDRLVEGRGKDAAPKTRSFKPYEWEYLKDSNEPRPASTP